MSPVPLSTMIDLISGEFIFMAGVAFVIYDYFI